MLLAGDIGGTRQTWLFTHPRPGGVNPMPKQRTLV